MDTVIDLLSRPVYGMSQVDRVLVLAPGTARRWIDGYARAGRTYPPVVRAQTTGSDVVTWGEFTEVRLLREYRRAGVPMLRMRPAVERLREIFNVLHPLAYAHSWLDVAGKELVLNAQEAVGLEGPLRFIVVRNGQLTLSLPADRYVESADWGEPREVIRRLRPYRDLSAVWLDPLRQFGEPTVRSVPTTVIAEQYRAGDRMGMIAKLYELPEDWVEQAIMYEMRRGELADAA